MGINIRHRKQPGFGFAVSAAPAPTARSRGRPGTRQQLLRESPGRAPRGCCKRRLPSSASCSQRGRPSRGTRRPLPAKRAQGAAPPLRRPEGRESETKANSRGTRPPPRKQLEARERHGREPRPAALTSGRHRPPVPPDAPEAAAAPPAVPAPPAEVGAGPRPKGGASRRVPAKPHPFAGRAARP